MPASGDPVFSSFTAGITPGNAPGLINSPNSRQTWVSAGPNDQYVPILLTAQGSAGAVRIGNSVAGSGSELLSKTFTVNSSQSLINFWYAVVFEDPGHGLPQQPSFWVRVLDPSDNPILGLVNLGNGSDKLVASASDPFFQSATVPGFAPLRYRDWTCAQINLSRQVGQTVTVQFVTEGCAAGAHFGYAYVDNFCGNCAGSPAGSTSFDAATSSNCGRGGLCFNYTLPTAAGSTGSVTISLGIYQNGGLLANMTSPVLTTGTSHCFNITPAGVPGMNASLGGLDYVATGTFALSGATPAPMSVGAAPDGTLPGPNNDYQIACLPPPGRWCCPGRNLVAETGLGDGNDLVLDDISLQLKPPVPQNLLLVNISTDTSIGGGQYTVSANPINLPSGYGYVWVVCELDSAGNCLPATTVTNPSAWWLPFPNDFKGYVGTSTLGPLTSPGKFSFNKRYEIKFKAWSD